MSTQAIDLRPARVDLHLYGGDDVTLVLAVTNPDGSAANLSGAAAAAAIAKPNAANPAATFGASIAANVVTLTLDGAQTAELDGPYVWDCQLTYTGGAVSTIAAGDVKVTPDVTR